MNTALALARQRAAVPATIEDPGPEGEAARATLGAICSPSTPLSSVAAA